MPVPQTVFAADLGGTKLSAALIGQRGRILARATQPVDRSSASALVEQICPLAAQLAGSRQVAAELASRGIAPPMFVSPNVPGIAADNNAQVFAAYQRSLER